MLNIVNEKMSIDQRRSYCNAWFPNYPEIRNGCRNLATATKGAAPLSACDFIENYLAGGDFYTVQTLGFDCNSQSGQIGTETAQYKTAQQQARQNRVYWIAGAAIIAAIAAIYLITKNGL